ncbi:cation-transporting P-type ATPase [Marinobacterium jannaschii]|uniref:cation-transporting P-type ATPase n=1 Tax=Marinobacterium jannaschii TaxID=64970 RepID=UPI000489D722|nr:cation-transporting P-type ATPase [Marinobacterium jannaschii]
MNSDWHARSSEQCFTQLDASPQGLDSQQARSRLQQYGANQLAAAPPRPPWKRFLSQLNNVLIYVLLAAAAVTLMLGHYLDSGVILGVVLLNALIGFIQEGKAEDALQAIRRMLSPQATVLRDHQRSRIAATELVPGDVVLLQSGDRVPADLRLFQLRGLQAQEAVLTGESLAVEKSTAPLPEHINLADRSCMAYSGTLITCGQGRGLVVATGEQTEIGRISVLVAAVEKISTPLLRQIDRLANRLTATILSLAVATFAFGILLRDYPSSDMFLAAVGLAVAAIPEGLPAIITITLAIGVRRMAQRNAIIRRLPAVETLGAVSVICSDKTGTLTCNEMTVRTIATPDGDFELSGSGYDSHGAISRDGQELGAEEAPLLAALLQAGVLCNDASLQTTETGPRVNGDPMEAALLVAAVKGGLAPQAESHHYPRRDLIPFESQHRFMASLHHSHQQSAFICLKGAPEKVLELCRYQQGPKGREPLARQHWQLKVEAMAARGQRVLAIARKEVGHCQQELAFDHLDGMTLLGLFGLIDPPRPEAVEAIRRCHSAGIRVMMITGDHATTAQAIARQVGLKHCDQVLTGQALESLDDQQLAAKVTEADIYARVSPGDKLRLVRSLQSRRRIVAMTGDGVNDAPALKQADVGTAMGLKGTEAAKEAAEMVLADDNFASITAAMEEGRTVYDNIRKAILFILPTNGGEALCILTAILLGYSQIPLTPVQILWVNMITAVTLALALAFEPGERDIMQRPPRPARESLLPPLFLWRIGFVALVMTIGTFGLFSWQLSQGSSVAEARTVAVNSLVMFEIFYLFNARYILAPVLNREGMLGNRYLLLAVCLLLLAQLAFTYLAPLQTLFGTAPISLTQWAILTLVASSVLFLVEIEKHFSRRR